jgi:DNA-binding NarL/FixJ family response regulator
MENVMERKRIILADDHVPLRDAIKNLLEPEFEIVGTFHDGHSLVNYASGLNPDVIIMDIWMPKMNGISAGQRLRTVLPKVKLIYLTTNLDPDLAAEAFRFGASGYLAKTAAASELVHGIREVLRGRPYITPLMTKGMVGYSSQKDPNNLTLSQKEVLQLLAEGRSMKEVAFILNVTPRTVAFHKYTMMEQLRLRTDAELIQFALKTFREVA